MYEFTKFMFNNKERWSEEHTNIYVHHPILQALKIFYNKSWKTFFKAKLWAGSAGDSVDATIEALAGKLSTKGARQQGVGDVSHHLLCATLLSLQIVGLYHRFAEEE